MARVTKKDLEQLRLEDERKEKNRLAVKKHREKKSLQHQVTLSLNSINYELLLSLREKLGYPSIQNNEKGTAEILGQIVGYLLKYEADFEPPEKSKSSHIREIYRRHRIANYWMSVDELSDYGRVQEINALGISNIDYYYSEVMNWDCSELSPEWTEKTLKTAANYRKVNKSYIGPLKAKKTKNKKA